MNCSLLTDEGLLFVLLFSYSLLNFVWRSPFLFFRNKNKHDMKKILLLILCWPVVLAAQNGIKLSNLAVNADTVTFDLHWTLPMPSVTWSDTVWVFVDYNIAGRMKRLPLRTGATLTATSAPGTAQVVEEPGNNNGVWVIGNARDAGRFSASVRLLAAVNNIIGACAYASNYHPGGTYTSPTSIVLSGSPMFSITMRHTDGSLITTQSNSPYLVPAGYTPIAFTDATGMPGRLGCIPMTGSLDFAVPAAIGKGQRTAFVVTTRPTAATPLTFHWTAPDFDPALQLGSTSTFTTEAPAVSGTYPVTVTAQAAGYCSLSLTKQVTLNNCTEPAVQTLVASAAGFCAGGAGVVFALNDTESGAQYQLYKDGAAAGTILAGRGGAATFTGTFDVAGAYTAQALDNGMYCAAPMRGAHTIAANPTPAAPNITQPADQCRDSGNLVFTAGGYTGTLVWTSNGGGTENGDNVTFTSDAVGTKTVTARSEQSYPGAPTCYSTTVTRSATVHAPPTISTQPQGQAFCETAISATLTVAAAAGGGSTLAYQWKKAEAAAAGVDVGGDSSTLTDNVTTRTDYWVVVTDNNRCTATSDRATIVVDAYTGGAIGSGTVCGDGAGRIGK
jgi:hypothetical protein